jgi:opacity protein-like surface antigen
MKKFLALAVAAGALAVAAPASAQSWQSINQRQANLDQRIDAGVRNGDLTRNEAIRLRAEFNDIARLEARYRASYGLSSAERADLDRRFDALSARVRFERNDRNDRGNGWMPINQRQRQLDARIDAGVRDGSLSRREASRLRAEFQQIVNLEARYRRNGLDRAERIDLDRRMDRLSATIQAERQDWNDRRRRG